MKVYGRNVIKELLMSDKRHLIKNIFISKEAEGSIESLKADLQSKGLNYSLVPAKTLDHLLGERVSHQGIFADIDEYTYLCEDEYIQAKSVDEQGFLICLDQINDPQNFGAIIRTAYGAGAEAVVITKDNSVQVNPTVIKVSTGLVFNMPVIQTVNLSRFLDNVKSSGFWIYSADMDGEDYNRVEWDKKSVLVFGNEGKGIRRLVKEKCDITVSIPMKREMDSLNLSVSVGILAFSVALKR
ncbi:MAG TPA: 23S rRNA (guanosine(2251)-2'-O)-methyltransferase RlmB [Thermotogota bacterium]|nr:23S rRNA (guanosine(2251)-2'-O)-methyltransferase RlmB [Thermotogota bacterium]HRW34406.1 23S rRNA (guanosine(2251)-2'-O)-methyltransferase RlmB [Thermotogota bacterium]